MPHPSRSPSRPICLITGATDGIGKATAIILARKGFKLVIAARNMAKAGALRAEIEALTGVRDVGFIPCDLRSLDQVEALAETVRANFPRLDVLINNAGIMAPSREETTDGLEASFQVNYLSAFLLTHRLLDPLKASGQGRIVNLSSNVYAMGRFDPDNLQGERRYSAISAYAASKLFLTLFTVSLAERLKGSRVTANAVHPGVVRTQMLATAKGPFKLVALLATPFARTPEQGAGLPVRLASAPDLDNTTGLYFAGSRPQALKTPFNTNAARDDLWRSSAELLEARGFVVDRIDFSKAS
jgi:NAD(P)-dependent dehydrogenase (short-subunit alcohol dehydrogenase family)